MDQVASAEQNPEPRLRYPDAELAFALVYPVGTDYTGVQLTLENYIKRFNYTPNTTHLSDFIPEILSKINAGVPVSDSPEADRINSRMTAGNKICQLAKDGSFIVAAAIAEISRTRNLAEGAASREPLPRTAHIFISLKRPEEVEMLRAIYGTGFFLIGISATENDRLRYLSQDKNVPVRQAVQLMKRDQEEAVPFGQRSRRTFELADVFVRLKSDDFKGQLERFLDLVFGCPYKTPEPDEHGMFLAYSASLRSGQLARQIGASVRNAYGDIIATGCNDVPRAGGGLYWPGQGDARDHVLGFDSNDREQTEIVQDLLGKLEINMKLEDAIVRLEDSRLMDITEYGRAVHAEMDALLTCSRVGSSPVGGTVFTTTFPCHNCARHILAVGIKRVVYIEPYPKSMASKLHRDAIELTGTGSGRNDGRQRIPFEPFVGIGPRRFFDLFSMKLSSGYPIKRKADGKTIVWRRESSGPRVQMLPTSYIQREKLAAAKFTSTVKKFEESQRGIQRFSFAEE
jgi:deoxycytidylate deaminase